MFVGDENRIVAGRLPADDDLAAIRQADAVILPQGCRQDLYEMARTNARHVFPNYDVRFRHPGKTGQAQLFQQTKVRHPRTVIFRRVADARQQIGANPRQGPVGFPFVFKLDWGGEGETVFLVENTPAWDACCEKASEFEGTGQHGFIIQEFIPCERRSLRVVVVGDTMLSYWRIQQDPALFLTGLGAGAAIDHDFEPETQRQGRLAVAQFCKTTGIDLAGFDMLFHVESERSMPMFLEINWFFGRRGLGGSDVLYALLDRAIRQWLIQAGLGGKIEAREQIKGMS
jgi:ribosomal protein S6--L-glutamate ligase